MPKPAVAETIEGEYTETTALAVRSSSAAPAAWVPTFAVAVHEAVERVEAKREFFRRVMRESEHYGVIPGTGTKPALLKPGAELLLSNMGLRTELTDADSPTIDYGDEGREGLIRFRRVCRVYRQTGPTVAEREIVAQAEGSCSSREVKYRWRDQKRKCPQCGVPAIIVGKKEYGGGYLCFKKNQGCGAKFKDGDPAIEGQTTGRIPNPDLADIENTVLKMADKRALVAATLLATGCSDIFTQDVEDFEPPASRPSQRDEEPPFEPEPSERTERAAPASQGVSEAQMRPVASAIARLRLEAPEIAKMLAEATEGRLTNADDLRQINLSELAQLRELIAAEGARRKSQPCADCKAKPDADQRVEHVWDKYGMPCSIDHSDAANEARALAAARERDHQEIPL